MACPEPPVVTQFSSPTFSPARTPTCIRPPAAKLLPLFHKQPCSLLPLCLYTNTSASTTLFSLPTKIIILHNPTQASVPLAYHPSHTESALSWVPLLSSLPQLSHLPSIPALIPLSHNCVADAVQNMGVHICVCRIGGGFNTCTHNRDCVLHLFYPLHFAQGWHRVTFTNFLFN